MKTQSANHTTLLNNLLRYAGALFAVLAVLSGSGGSALAQRMDHRAGEVLKTATFNAYIGADLAPVVAIPPVSPGDPGYPEYVREVIAAATKVYLGVVASDPPRRLAGIAREIGITKPHVVAVQELYSIYAAPMTQTGAPGDFVETYNYLDLLTDALAAQGLHYTVASVSTESQAVVPMMIPPTFQTVGYGMIVDHDAILVRTDVPDLEWANPQHGNFDNNLTVGGITLTRGWCSIDLSADDYPVRFVCSHLEEETSPEIQSLQAQELLDGPADVAMPVILTGDLNADPLGRNGSPVFPILAHEGFKDAWQVNGPHSRKAGLTWGHDPELSDPAAGFVWRIDLILYRGPAMKPASCETIDLSLGNEPPLWPSDHAGVAAQFVLRKEMGRNSRGPRM